MRNMKQQKKVNNILISIENSYIYGLLNIVQ